MCSSPDWTSASLDFLGGRKGLTDEFDYRTVCLHVLSGVLYKATGMTPQEYADKYLFAPLGIAPRKNYYAANAVVAVTSFFKPSVQDRIEFIETMKEMGFTEGIARCS